MSAIGWLRPNYKWKCKHSTSRVMWQRRNWKLVYENSSVGSNPSLQGEFQTNIIERLFILSIYPSMCSPPRGGNRNNSTSVGGERVKMKQEFTDFNKQWFIGFCDAESSFSINPVVNSENIIKKILCLVLNCTKMI